jgi:hypothetical protein
MATASNSRVLRTIPLLILIYLFSFPEKAGFWGGAGETNVQAATINVPSDLPTIQDGINAATNGDTVLVGPGTYVENINFNGKDIVVGSLMLTTGDASYIDQTVIDGNQNGSVVTFESGEDSTAILNGFTITNGSGTWIHGGGIFLDDNSCPILINLIVTGNVAYAANGAGICCLNNSDCRIENVIVTGNDGLGSGQYNYNPNGTNDGTGGVYLGNSSPTLRNVVIANNTGLLAGGMFCNSNSNPALINVTIAGNTALPQGYYNETAEIITWGNSNPVLTNTIIWNDSLAEIILRDNAITISYSDVQGGLNGIVTHDDATVNWLDGNIDSEPMFVDPINMDYRLQGGSPCIDAGDNSVIPRSRFGVTDLDGNPRIANGTVDMGAYEGRIVQPKTAYNPNPADGAEYVYPNVELSWSSGFGAQLHIVYFGDNLDDVNIEAGGILQETTIYIPGPLEWDKVYYWRVDEFDGVVIHKGEVWSFSIPSKTTFTPQHFAITYYDNYNYDTGQWDAWQSDATPRDAWDDKYLADGLSGNTVYTDHAFTSIPVFNLRVALFSKDGHASGGEDWNPLQSIGDNVSGQSAHHVFAALFKGLIYLEEGDVLRVASDDDVYIFLDDDTEWGQEVLSVPYISRFGTDSMTVTASQAGYHMMTVKFIERRNIHSGIEITLNGEHLQNAEVSGLEDFETGNFSKFSWWHSGDSNWTISQREKHSGAYSAESGTIGDDESTTLVITLECVSGDISFYRKVSSESGFDYLKFYIDGVKKGAWSGEEDWAEVSFQVDEGTRTFEWTYSKDDSVSDGDDTAWIDDIVFPLKSSPPVGPAPPDEPKIPEGFDLYLDDIAPNIEKSNWITNGLLDYYSADNPASGDYCIHWTGADLWNMISFRFSPVKDLSVLVDEGFAIDFWVRCDSPNARILIRFMDTNTDDPGDHPWRIIYPIDRNVAVWDGRWNHLQIPLYDFYEQGSWDFDNDRWYNPVGAFDWTATEHFEILAEYSDLAGIHFYFDAIRVVEPDTFGRP